MIKVLEILGTIAAIVGVVLCVAAGISRLAGLYALLQFETMTLFDVGVGFMVAACLAKLYTLESHGRD